jgi:arsenate reductase (glutaredoxin)
MGVIIYHNPRCSKSRETLAILNEKQCDVTVVEYLDKSPGMFELKNILRFLNMKPRDILRTGEPVYKELKLDRDGFSDMDLIKIMVKYPILIERPIVVNGEKAIIGRPPEKVLTIL